MSNGIINATPLVRNLGIKDDSTRPLVREPESLPTHLPKVYAWAQRGPKDPRLVVGGSRDDLYGTDSFDLKKKWANHATVLSNVVNARGNAQMFQRVVPTDAAVANLRVSLLMTKDPIDLFDYKRTEQGYIDLVTGKTNHFETTTKKGYIGKIVVEHIDSDFGAAEIQSDLPAFTSKTIGASSAIGAVSKYPLFDLQVATEGEYGNNCGITLVPLSKYNNTGSDGAPAMLKEDLVFPFRLLVKERINAASSAKIKSTLSGEQEIQVCFKPDYLDEATGASMYLGDGFLPKYESLNVPNMTDIFGLFGKIHVYDENYKTAVKLIADAESKLLATQDVMTAVDKYKTNLDFYPVDANKGKDLSYAVNLFTGSNYSGVPYFTFRLLEDSQAFEESTVLYAQGGSDGTMDDKTFSALVAADMQNYADDSHEYQDTAKYPESIFYDTGFCEADKSKLIAFIQKRHDTCLVLSTFDATEGKPLSPSLEKSRGEDLKTALTFAPESSYFGTSVARGIVQAHCGKLMGSPYKKYLPLTIELADKCAAYMGAGDGVWNPTYAFDKYPLNLVTMFTDVSNPYTNLNTRYNYWKNGVNWVQNFDRSSLFWPAFKTVYSNDTSVLTSIFTMFACVELQKIHDRVWRMFTGRSDLTSTQLVNAVDKAITSMTLNRFDGRFIIEPKSIVTEADKQRGYSWTTQTAIYAANMKTVGTFSISTRRLDDHK